MTRHPLCVGLLGAVATLSAEGCSRPELPTTPPAQEPLERRADPLVLEFIPSHLPTTLTSPFGGPTAGSGVWPFQSGPAADAQICRECTFTGVGDLMNGSCTTGCIDDHMSVKATGLSVSQVPGTLASYTNALFDFGTNTTTQAPQGLEHLVEQAVAGPALATFEGEASWLSNFANEFIGNEDVGLCALLTSWIKESAPNTDFKCEFKLFDEPQTWVEAYKPNQWRFLGAEFVNPTQPVPPNPAQLAVYNPYPLAFMEERMRGARSFCAMREAAFAQAQTNKRTMGSVSLGSGVFSIFSAGETETQVDVGPPQKFTTSNSANAFVIPLAIRTRVSPLHGPLVPTMPENSTPVVWVTGDAEVLSAEQFGPVLVGFNRVGQPIYQSMSRKAYVNGQHTDIFMGQHNQGSLNVILKIPIWAAVFAETTILLEFESGKLVKGFSGAASGGLDWSVAGDGRVLVLPPENFGGGQVIFPAPRSPLVDSQTAGGSITRPWMTPGGLFLATDAPWFASKPAFGLANGVFVPVEADIQLLTNTIPMGFGVRTRAMMDDDRSMVIMNRTHEHFHLGVGVGFSLGPLSVNVVGSTDADGDTRQFVTLREHASGVGTASLLPIAASTPGRDRLGPQTNFVAIPEVKSKVTAAALSIDAFFEIDIDLGILPFHKEWKVNFLTLGGNDSTIASFIFPEHRRLRVGEYSDFGFEFQELLPDPNGTFRSVYSHLADPNSATPQSFASFPLTPGAAQSSQDVGRCLDDPKVPPLPPPVKPGKKGEPPFQTCAWGLPGADDSVDIWNIPANICAGAPAYPQIETYLKVSLPGVVNGYPYLELTEKAIDSVRKMLRFLCDVPDSKKKIQPWGPFAHVISRVIDMAPIGQKPTKDQETLSLLVKDCLLAFGVGPTKAEAQLQGDWVGDFLVPRLHACLPDATLQGEFQP